MDQAFTRLSMLLGGEGMTKLASARVAVFGMGAVGSFATEALARCSVGYLRLVDFDEVKPSNINRQLYALNSTVGRQKVELAASRVQDINPGAVVDARKAFFHADTAHELLGDGLDFVIDAIDSLNPKVSLILESRQRDIPIVSAMGAARRMDPFSVRVTDISKVKGCPLSAIVRKRIHRHGIYTGVTAVWSTEPVIDLPEAGNGDASSEETETFKRGRVRKPLPSIVFGPAAFGLAAAHFVVTEILKKGQ
jgi:tRNA A37 threonylcarbamoyladenosine dehydratase